MRTIVRRGTGRGVVDPGRRGSRRTGRRSGSVRTGGVDAPARSGGPRHEDEGREDGHKVEQADGGGVTVQTMDGGDTASLPVTLDEAERQLAGVGVEAQEVVAEGYHSNKTMTGIRDRGWRSYVSEPDRGRRSWKRNRDAQKPTYAVDGSGAGGASGSVREGRRSRGDLPTCWVAEDSGVSRPGGDPTDRCGRCLQPRASHASASGPPRSLQGLETTSTGCLLPDACRAPTGARLWAGRIASSRRQHSRNPFFPRTARAGRAGDRAGPREPADQGGKT